MSYDITYFENKISSLQSEIDLLNKRSSNYSLIRLFSFVLAAISLVLTKILSLCFLIPGVLFLLFFILICIKHYKIYSVLKHKRVVRDINEEYVARIKGDFSILRDNGEEFIKNNHDYCIDLDIFGKSSIYSLYNISESAFGREKFANELLNAHISSRSNDELRKMQDAIHEISEDVDFLVEYQALSRQAKMSHMPMALLSLADIKEDFFTNKKKVLSRLLLLLWIFPLSMFVMGSKLLIPAILLVILINLIVSLVLSGEFSSYLKMIDGISRQCEAIYMLFERIERKGFNSELIESLLKKANKEQFPSVTLKKLSKVCFLCSFRSQPLLALILNSLCLFDMLCADRLNDWVMKYKGEIVVLIDVLATIEAMMSASVVEIVTADSSRPVIVDCERNSEDNALFDGVDIVHPLLKRDSAVSNTIKLDSEIAIITGSNMSGKTTLIRTIGVISVLAYIGAYVPASRLSIGRMRIVSSMRIVDSLGEDMSTFKAELVRISSIVNAKRENKPILFLIDEIFRGTNSADRTSGAMAVLRSLSDSFVIGLMTTHDYALCDQASEELNGISYYHFSEKYDDFGINFDYVLKSGISNESNAKYLMKLVGIVL